MYRKKSAWHSSAYGIEAVRSHLSDLLEQAHHGVPTVIIRHGKPYAAVVSVEAVSSDIAVLATRLRLADAIQTAVAVHKGCYALVTHDRDIHGLIDLLALGTELPT